MARAGKRGARKSSRPRGDWVYRSNMATLGTAALNNDVLGTYESGITTLTTGVEGASSKVLYDSRDYVTFLAGGGRGAAGTLATMGAQGGHARAEGKKACILGVEGVIYSEPTVWAIGSLMALGIRIGVFEQDVSGVFSVDGEYSMFQTTVGSAAPPAHWANNTRNNVYERRVWKAFGDASASPLMVTKVRFRCRKYLEGYECFGLFVEGESTGVNLRMQYWLRTFVSDEG